MQPRHVGTRHQEHKIFWRVQVAETPSRQEGARIAWQERAVFVSETVGIPGWDLPEVAILDVHGLNDWVVARNPVPVHPDFRLMAHERYPPPGYLECFEPNIYFENGALQRAARQAPLTDERIAACERSFRGE